MEYLEKGETRQVCIEDTLYIVSNDKIEIGELCYHSNIEELVIADEFSVENPDCKKILSLHLLD